jgi:hypothetical protein
VRSWLVEQAENIQILLRSSSCFRGIPRGYR